MAVAAEPPSLLLHTVENLADFHREHEKFYAAGPREQAVVLQRHAGTLHEVADRAAAELDGVLFLEGQGEPAGLAALRLEVRAFGQEAVATGEWMTKAMASSWSAAGAILEIAALDDLLGERHRIIANDWQAAGTTAPVGRLLGGAAGGPPGRPSASPGCWSGRPTSSTGSTRRRPPVPAPRGCCTRPRSSSPGRRTCSASRPAWCRTTSAGGGSSTRGSRPCWPPTPRRRRRWPPSPRPDRFRAGPSGRLAARART